MEGIDGRKAEELKGAKKAAYETIATIYPFLRSLNRSYIALLSISSADSITTLSPESESLFVLVGIAFSSSS